MEITLIRTGGFIPILKKASIKVDISETELNELSDSIKAEDAPGKTRDNTQYQLMYNSNHFNINLEKIPTKYKELFEKLKDNLKIVKP